MVGRPTRSGRADQIAWEELFLLSLYQMTQSSAHPQVKLTLQTSNEKDKISVNLEDYFVQFCFAQFLMHLQQTVLGKGGKQGDAP